MRSKMLDRLTHRPATRIIVDDAIVVRDPMTAHLMQAPRYPRNF